MLEKTWFVLFERSINLVPIDMMIDGSVLEGKSYFKMLQPYFLSKLSSDSYIASITKTSSKITRTWSNSMKP